VENETDIIAGLRTAQIRTPAPYWKQLPGGQPSESCRSDRE